MKGALVVQKKKSLDMVPVLQRKKEEKIIQELKTLKADFDSLSRILEKAGLRLGGRSIAYDDQLMTELFKIRPDDAKLIIAFFEKIKEKSDKLYKDMESVGIYRFIDHPDYLDVYVGSISRWRDIISLGKKNLERWQKQEREKLKELEPKKYPTISEARGPGIPFWKRPAIQVPGSGLDRLRYGGEKLYLEKGVVVPESILKSERDFERRFLSGEFKGKKFLNAEDFMLFLPLIPFLDAALIEANVMWDKGFSWKGTGRIVLNLAFAGLDVVGIGQVATKTAARAAGRKIIVIGQLEAKTPARATGRQIALSMEKSEGILTMSRPELNVLETAILELKPGEIKDLWRIARPPKGSGLGWTRVYEDLAIRAGENEITGDILRSYIKEKISGRFGRTLTKAGKGTADYFSNGLSFFGRERFRDRAAAEIFNELRIHTDLKAARELVGGLRSARLPEASRRVASDAIFYSLTSFSPKVQQSLLKLVDERGWGYLTREMRGDILKARRINSADPVSTGVRNCLARLIPKYERVFRYPPIRPIAQYGIGHGVGIFLGYVLGQVWSHEPQKPKVVHKLVTEEDLIEELSKRISVYKGEKY